MSGREAKQATPQPPFSGQQLGCGRTAPSALQSEGVLPHEQDSRWPGPRTEMPSRVPQCHDPRVHGETRASRGTELGPPEGGRGPGGTQEGAYVGEQSPWSLCAPQAWVPAGSFKGLGPWAEIVHMLDLPTQRRRHSARVDSSGLVSHRPAFRVDSARPGCMALGCCGPEH